MKKELQLLSLQKIGYLDQIIRTGVNYKSHQNIVFKLKLTSKDVENVIFIGDNPYTDIIGAKKIGFKTAWIKMDFEYPKDLSPPDYIIESFNEIEV